MNFDGHQGYSRRGVREAIRENESVTQRIFKIFGNDRYLTFEKLNQPKKLRNAPPRTMYLREMCYNSFGV